MRGRTLYAALLALLLALLFCSCGAEIKTDLGEYKPRRDIIMHREGEHEGCEEACKACTPTDPTACDVCDACEIKRAKQEL
jgi:hypothetical protein